MTTFAVTREWRYEGYEGGIEDSVILIDGQLMGGVYHCEYNSAARIPGWGWNDGGLTGESWASYGPRGYSFGHSTREAAEHAQLREYATNPDLYDRLNAQDRAEEAARQAAQDAEDERRDAERARLDRLRRLGDDEPGPTVWTLPAYHVLYAPQAEIDAVSAWFEANGLSAVSAVHEVRVEQRATRWAIVYEAVARPWWQGRSGETETRAVTLTTDPPAINTPDRPELHDLLEEHWPARFPLIDFGGTMACRRCTLEARATGLTGTVPWPCPTVEAAISP